MLCFDCSAAASRILSNKNLTMHNVCEYVDMLHQLQVEKKDEAGEGGDVKMSSVSSTSKSASSSSEPPSF